VAVPILSACINCKPVHLARTATPAHVKAALVVFDERLDVALARCSGSEVDRMPRESGFVRCLPQEFGGLGLPRMADIHEAAFSASYVAAHELLAGTIPAFAVLLAGRARDFADLGEVVHTHCPHLFVNDRPEEGLKLWRAPAAEEDALLPETPKQKALVAPLVDGWRERLELELSANRDRAALAWWRSGGYKHSAILFLQAGLSYRFMPVTAYRSQLARRLMLPVQLTGDQLACSLCEDAEDPDARFHHLTCTHPTAMSIRTRRHTAVQHSLFRLLTRLFGTAAVGIGPTVHAGTKADLSLQIPGATSPIFIDISVTSPTTVRALQHHSDQQEDVAAVLQEERKRERYRAALAAQNLREDALVPFVLEATGRCGPAATAFLESLATRPGVRREVDIRGSIRYFRAHMAGHILAANAKAQKEIGSTALRAVRQG
jgi:hypothetical protein